MRVGVPCTPCCGEDWRTNNGCCGRARFEPDLRRGVQNMMQKLDPTAVRTKDQTLKEFFVSFYNVSQTKKYGTGSSLGWLVLLGGRLNFSCAGVALPCFTLLRPPLPPPPPPPLPPGFASSSPISSASS